jgi:ketosteroid isomerase-like protein
MTNNKELAVKFWKAANEGDLDILSTLVSDDCRFLHSDVSGKKQVVQHFKPDPQRKGEQRVQRFTADGDVVVVESIWSGNAYGPYFDSLMGKTSSGKRFEVPIVTIMEFKNGLIKTFNAVFNELELKQILTE